MSGAIALDNISIGLAENGVDIMSATTVLRRVFTPLIASMVIALLALEGTANAAGSPQGHVSFVGCTASFSVTNFTPGTQAGWKDHNSSFSFRGELFVGPDGSASFPDSVNMVQAGYPSGSSQLWDFYQDANVVSQVPFVVPSCDGSGGGGFLHHARQVVGHVVHVVLHKTWRHHRHHG